jgi:hypothetical protein
LELDVSRVEAAEDEIDRFILKRHKEKQEANAQEEYWKRSEERYERQRQEERRQAWVDYHEAQAEAHERSGREFAEMHRQRARQLRRAGS